MGYASRDGFISRYGERELCQLTDRENVGVIDEAVLAKAVADADEEVNGYLQDGGYTLPISPIPYRLTRHACALARCFLYDDIKPDEVREDCEKAVAFLEKVAEGTVILSGHEAEGKATGIAAAEREMAYDDDFVDQYG